MTLPTQISDVHRPFSVTTSSSSENIRAVRPGPPVFLDPPNATPVNVQLQPELELEELLEDYAVCLPECRELSPIVHWFKRLLVKICRLFGLMPSVQARLEVNFGLLANVVRGSKQTIAYSKSMLLDYFKKAYALQYGEDVFFKRLDFAFSIARQIEKLQGKASLHGQESALKVILSAIKHKIDTMAADEKLLLPAGWFSKSKQACDGMLEFHRLANGKWNVRFLSLEEELSPSFMHTEVEEAEQRVPYIDFQEVDQHLINESLLPLLLMQLPQLQQADVAKEGFLARGISALKRMYGDDAETTDKEFSPVELLYNCFERTQPCVPAYVPAYAMRVHKNGSCVRTLFAYLKVQDPARYKHVKLQLEIKTFNNVLKASSDLLAVSKELRHECYDGARRLVYRLEKEIKRLDLASQAVQGEVTLQALACDRAQLQQAKDIIIVALQQLHQNEVSDPKVSRPIAEWSFSGLFESFRLGNAIDPSKLVSMDSAASAPTNLSQDLLAPIEAIATLNGAEPLEVDRIELASRDFVAQLTRRLQACQQLYNAGEYASLKQAAAALVATLPPPGQDNFWQKVAVIGLSNQSAQIKELGQKIFTLSQFSFDAQRLEDPYGSNSELLISFAKLQAINDQLMLFEGQFAGYCFDPSPILDLINKDNYFRSIDPKQHKEASCIAAYWKTQLLYRQPIELEYPRALQESVFGHDLDFAQQNGGQDLAQMLADNSLLDAGRQMRLLAKILVYKGRNLASHKGTLSAASALATDSGIADLSRQQLWQKAFQANMHQIKAELSESYALNASGDRPLSTVPFTQYALRDGGVHILLQPGNIKYSNGIYYNYQRWMGKEELFRADGRFISEDVERQVVHFELSDRSTSDQRMLTQPAVMQITAAAAIRDLRTVQSKKKRLEQTVALFMSHPEYFKESSFYRVFECNFFAQDVLLRKLERNVAYGESLAQFFKRHYDLALSSGDVSFALSFLNLQTQMRGFVDIANLAPQAKIDLLHLLPDEEVALQKFAELQALASTEADKRCVLQAKLSCMDSCFKQGSLSLTSADSLLSFLSDYLKMKQIPAHSHLGNPAQEISLQNAIIRLMPAIQDLLDGNVQAVHALFAAVGVPDIQGMPVQARAPLYTIGEHALDLAKGLKFYAGKALTHMPEDTALQSALFSITHSTGNRECSLEYHVDAKDGSRYAIYTLLADPHIRVIQKGNQPLVLQWQRERPHSLLSRLFSQKEWFQYTCFKERSLAQSPSDTPLTLGKVLCENHVWVNISDSSCMLVTHKDSGDLEYVMSLKPLPSSEVAFDSITRTKDGKVLMNPWETSAEILGQLNGLEANQHILVWGNGQEPEEIVFPRLIMGDDKPLTYSISCQAGVPKLHCKQLCGYNLDVTRPPIMPESEAVDFDTNILPVSFDQYHLLSSSDGRPAKVMLTVQELLPKDIARHGDGKAKDIGPWFNRAYYERNIEEFAAQKVAIFEVDAQKKTLKNDSQEAMAMAAYLFFAHKHYAAAAQYLTQAHSNLAHSTRHAQIYGWIQKWPDSSQEAIAFKLKAAIQREENYCRLAPGELRPLAEEIQQVAALQALKLKYDSFQQDLPPDLQLSDKERRLLQQVQEASILAITTQPRALEPSLRPPKAIAEQFPWPTQNLTANIAAACREYWIKIGTGGYQLHQLQGLTVKADERLMKGFKHIYQDLFNAPVNSAEFAALKRAVLIQHPKQVTAQTLQRSLLALIRVKETQPSNLDDYRWPEPWERQDMLDHFEYGRLRILTQSANVNVNRLENLLRSLNACLPAAQVSALAPNLQNPLQSAMAGRSLDRDKIQADTQLQAMAVVSNHSPQAVRSMQERADHLLAVERLCEQEDGNLESAFRLLHESGKLQQLRRDREEMQLENEKMLLNQRLATASTSQDSPPVLIAAGVVENLMAASSELSIACFQLQLDDSLANRENFAFLRQQEGRPRAAIRLAEDLYNDANIYVQQAAPSNYSLVGNDPIGHIQASMEAEKEHILNGPLGLHAVEQEIKSLLRLSLRHYSLLKPGLSAVPERLIGLYTESAINQENLHQHFGCLLTVDECLHVDALVASYMQKSVALKAAESVLAKVKALKGHATRITLEQSTELYHAINGKRYFNMAHPFARELLTIEYVNGYALRQKQVDTIQAMLQGSHMGRGQIQQMGMGEGKSSVLLPLLLKKYADGHHLAVGIIPEWLMEIVGEDLNHSSQALFAQKLCHFKFDRNTVISRHWLLAVYMQLGNAILNKEAVVTTKSDLLSLRNRFKELLENLATVKDEKKDEIREQLSLLSDILFLFKSRSKAIADEVDSILNIRQELIYAIGQSSGLEVEKVQVGIDIYRKMASWVDTADPLLKEFAVKLLNNQQATVLESTFTYACQSIAEDFYNRQENYLAYVSKSDFKAYILKMPQENLQDSPLARDAHIPAWLAELKEGHAALYQQIAYLRQFLGDTLKTTLSGNNKVTYGRAPDEVSTIPYKASNIPSEAEFGDSAERIAYYCQDYLQVGISRVQVVQYVESVKGAIQAEMQERMAGDYVPNFAQMPTYLRFQESYPSINIAKAFSDQQEQARLSLLLNQDSQTKLCFLQNWVLPFVQTAHRQACSNSHDLVDMLFEFNGFTGTPFNVNCYHDKIDSSTAKSPGTDGNSLAFLVAMSETRGPDGLPNCLVREVTIDSHDPLHSLIKGAANTSADFFLKYAALIDVGAYMKGISNETIGQQLGALVPTVIVDKNNQKVVFDGANVAPLEERKDLALNQRFTYYDQAHTTGTDIPQAHEARAAVTIGAQLYIKDLFQAIWRMRRLRKGQMCDFILSKEVADMIRGCRAADVSAPVSVQEIINFCINNQAKPTAEGDLRSEKIKIASMVPQQMFWQMVNLHRRKNGHQHLAENLFPLYASYLLKDCKEDCDLLATLSKEQATTTVLQDLKEKMLQAFSLTLDEVKNLPVNLVMQAAQTGVIESLERAIVATQERRLLEADKLPETTEAIEAGAQDTQVQTQRQQQQQLRIQMMASEPAIDLSARWQAWDVDSLESLWQKAIDSKPLSTAHPAFDGRLSFTNNFVPHRALDSLPNIRDKMLAKERNQVAQLVVMRHADEWQAMLIDVLDYERVVAPLFAQSRRARLSIDFEVAVLDLRPAGKSQVLCSSQAGNGLPDSWRQNAAYLNLIAQAKFFGAELNYFEPAEREQLCAWLGSLPDKLALQNFFEQKILPKSRASEYEHSYLRRQLSLLEE